MNKCCIEAQKEVFDGVEGAIADAMSMEVKGLSQFTLKVVYESIKEFKEKWINREEKACN